MSHAKEAQNEVMGISCVLKIYMTWWIGIARRKNSMHCIYNRNEFQFPQTN